jgi:hypothetical protein
MAAFLRKRGLSAPGVGADVMTQKNEGGLQAFALHRTKGEESDGPAGRWWSEGVVRPEDAFNRHDGESCTRLLSYRRWPRFLLRTSGWKHVVGL